MTSIDPTIAHDLGQPTLYALVRFNDGTYFRATHWEVRPDLGLAWALEGAWHTETLVNPPTHRLIVPATSVKYIDVRSS